VPWLAEYVVGPPKGSPHPPFLTDADRTGEDAVPIRGQGNLLQRLRRVRSVDHAPVAGVDPHMARGRFAVEEQQITGANLVARDPCSCVDLVIGGPGKVHARLGPGGLDQTGTVVAVGAGATPDVGFADLRASEVEHRLHISGDVCVSALSEAGACT